MFFIIFVQGTIQASNIKWGTPLLHQVHKSTMCQIINKTTHIQTHIILTGGTTSTYLGATARDWLDCYKILDNKRGSRALSIRSCNLCNRAQRHITGMKRCCKRMSKCSKITQNQFGTQKFKLDYVYTMPSSTKLYHHLQDNDMLRIHSLLLYYRSDVVVFFKFSYTNSFCPLLCLLLL